MPEALRKDISPNIVFISVSDGKSPAQVFLGTGMGIENAINKSIYHIKRSLPPNYNAQWIKIDLVANVHHPQTVYADKMFNISPSLEGIAFSRQTGIAFLPEELVFNTLVNSKNKLQSKKIDLYLQGQNNRSSVLNLSAYKGPLKINRFTTFSYFSDGNTSHRLYRGHRIFKEISDELLIDAAKQGGDYLKRSALPDGSFIYIYRPKSDTIPEDYNILRHAGSVYSMLEVYELTNDQQLMEAIRRAVGYLQRSMNLCEIGGEKLLCVVENSHVKLGGNALAAIALAKYIDITNSKKQLADLIQLGRWIQKSQLQTGEFYPHKQTYPDSKASTFVSQYYPGEALLALVRIYDLIGDESLLDNAEKGAKYLINVRDKDLPLSSLDHDHWFLYALNELYRHRSNPLYLKHAMRISKAIIQTQNLQPDYPDWYGSYYRPPRSTPTATRTEGLYAAYQLAYDFGDPDMAELIFESIQSGITFQLQTQFRPESTLYLKNPKRCLGGFHSSLTNFNIRIDYVQHNLSSILGMYRLRSDIHRKKETNRLQILFAGDTSFGENYQIQLKRAGGENILETKGYDYPLQKLKSIVLQSDAVIINLETPITDLAKSPFEGKKKYIHWVDTIQTPKYLKLYNIQTVSLANNHTLDYGIEGLQQTLEILYKNNIRWFGAGFNGSEAEKAYLKEFRIGQNSFRLAVIGGFEFLIDYDRKYNLYASKDAGGVNPLYNKKITEQIKKLKAANPDVFIVVFPHWGKNYKWKSETQTKLAYQMIDSGADLIIGHGAHMLQEVDLYRGKWIIYGIGNFIFNSKGRYQKYNVEPFSLLAQLLIQKKKTNLDKNIRLYPIISDNLITNYQPRFLTNTEFEKAYELLLKKSNNPAQLKRYVRTGKDKFGRFMEIPIF